MAVGPDEQNTEFAGYCATKAVCTDAVNKQLCPPIAKEKLAVPLVLGVPEMANESEPAPLANVPAVKVAVNPVTPVDEIV